MFHNMMEKNSSIASRPQWFGGTQKLQMQPILKIGSILKLIKKIIEQFMFSWLYLIISLHNLQFLLKKSQGT